ncbi:MAG: helix-turn-helix domain-containing protein [Firmicutes bacterium]|nr:helix-turn-helix domain-containing protein [Bacillota bacterium]
MFPIKPEELRRLLEIELASNLLFGYPMPFKEMWDYASYLGLTALPDGVLVVAIDDFWRLAENKSEGWRRQLKGNFLQVAREALASWEKLGLLLEGDSLALLLNTRGSEVTGPGGASSPGIRGLLSHYSREEALRRAGEEVRQAVAAAGLGTVTIGLGLAGPGAADLPLAFQEAQKALRERFYWGSNRVLGSRALSPENAPLVENGEAADLVAVKERPAVEPGSGGEPKTRELADEERRPLPKRRQTPAGEDPGSTGPRSSAGTGTTAPAFPSPAALREGDETQIRSWLAHMDQQVRKGRLTEEEARLQVGELILLFGRQAAELGLPQGKMARLVTEGWQELFHRTSWPGLLALALEVFGRFTDLLRRENQGTIVNTLAAVESYVRKNYHHPVSLRDAAKIAHFSPYYFSRYFQAQKGMTFGQFLTAVRMEAARELLLNTNLNIQEIARRVGYEKAGHFSRLFRQATGYTPSEFQARRKGG